MRKLLLLLVAVVALTTVSSAQSVKFGRVNTAEVIELMPESDTVRTKIEARGAELSEQIKYMQQELQKKVAALEKDMPNLSGLIREQRTQDVYDLQAKLETFAREADQDLAQYQQQILAPIFKKVRDAIDKVAKLNGITFVIDESGQVPFVYIDEAKVINITDKVKAQLKLKARK